MNPTNPGGKIRRFAITLMAAGLIAYPQLSAAAAGSASAQAGSAAPVRPSAANAGAGGAAENAGKYPAVIGTSELRAAAPLLRGRPADDADWRSLAAYDYRPEGGGLKLFAREGDWLHAKQDGQSGWIPAWYAGDEAAGIQYTPRAVRLTPERGARLHLAPGSKTSWAYDGGELISVLRFGDWYGVSPDSGRTTGGDGSHAMLLWLRADDAERVEPLEKGLLAPASDASLGSIRAALDGLLRTGTDEKTVRGLLGEPFSVTDARMLPPAESDPGRDGLHHWREGGREWRYERQDAHLLVRMSDSGRLSGLNWILPLTDYAQQAYSSWLQEPDFASLYRPLPLLPSLKPEIDWRAKIGVDYAYLDSGSDDVLLVNGDDGGFSGFHYSSIFYALDRISGRTLWKLDVGWSGAVPLPDSTGKGLTIDRYVPEGSPPNDSVVAHIRLRDKKMLWSLTPKESLGARVYAAKGVVLLQREAAEHGGEGTIVALDEQTGDVKWKQRVREPFGLANRDSGEPYVLLAQGHTLRALNPADGRAVWTVSSDAGSIDTGESLALDPSAPPVLARTDGTRWIKFDGEGWRKIDLKDGRTLARCGESENGRIEDIGGGYLLMQSVSGDEGFYRSQASDFPTSLVEASSGRKLWTRPGLIQSGLVDGDRLYAVVDRIPSALDLKSGHTVWETRTNGLHPNLNFTYGVGPFSQVGNYLLLPYDSDLLAFERTSGTLLGRIDGFRFGYPELHDRYVRRSLLNRQDGKLYVGSASRSFAVLDEAKLIGLLDDAAAAGRGAEAVTPASREAAEAAWYPAQPY
ncbi:outer membrane protein assembly factor BamB family protein [Saccharibacillus alkalitolerans]|uniref:PQQ-binding-like beta-propeller repeat protein n=1 Tax=Saccharibacillus alkalitolerans TaxID=2705290 RepID=A0ABX0F705_9BACL|nr:PQQ-binding-like beta-propeller repeat protein [Saccharibacillus alkalitolerans]NGZ76747.1 PQQ-binding-like beta-propeller repeat protein [Saccharibacillus alkalitolerans]